MNCLESEVSTMKHGVELKWKEDLIAGLIISKIKVRSITDRLFAKCMEEFDRLRGYLYVDSSLVIATRRAIIAP